MNEILLFLIAAVSAAFVVTAWRLGKERLYSVIIIFLILIAVAGGKIVAFFGFETNTGNIFYASVFLATYFLIERHGKREGIRSIWIGIIGVAFFSVLAILTGFLTGSQSTGEVNDALTVAFQATPRIAFASLIAYALSQALNVYIYIYLKQRFSGHHLWARANAANVAAQVLDSVVFFIVGFWGVVALGDVMGVMLTGFVIKVVYMMLASPVLYLNRVEHEEGKDFSAVSMR